MLSANMSSIVQTPEFGSVDDAEICRRMEEGLAVEWKRTSDDEWETESSDTESRHTRRVRIAKSRTLKLLELVEKRRNAISNRINEKLRIVEVELERRCEKIAQLIEDWSHQLDEDKRRKKPPTNPPGVQIFFEREQANLNLDSTTRKQPCPNDVSPSSKKSDDIFDEISVANLHDVLSSVGEDISEQKDCFLEIKAKLNVALAQAVQMGFTDEMRALFEAGAAVDESHYCGFSPLCVAVLFGRCEALSMLLQMGADPNIVSTRGWSPLHCAIARDQAEAVRILVKAGASLKLVHPSTGETPLQFATARGRKAATRALLEAGARTHMRDEHDRTHQQVPTTNTQATILANDRERDSYASCSKVE